MQNGANGSSPGNHDHRPKRNLRSMVIEPFKQIKFGIYVIAITLAFIGVTAFMFVTAFQSQYAQIINIFEVIDPKMRLELFTNDIFYTNAVRIGLIFVAFVAILLGVVFRLTHRYYGPLVSIERFIEALTVGEYNKRCKIREGDELHELVAKLNHMAEELERRHGAKASSFSEEETKKDNLAAS